jgi:hypothetical protein
MKKLITLILITFIMTGCASWKIPNTLGDPTTANNYGYHPLDPLPVKIDYLSDDLISNQRVLKALPDETIRLAVGQVNNQGGITFSTASVGYEGNSYVVILDYVKFNTVSFPVKLEKENNQKDIKASLTTDDNPDVIVPVYIGVGLRLTANITVKKGSVNLGNLFAIGAEASSEKISGTLVVQTLGISGENISSIIPMPGELNPTTIQNAIMALATIKSKIYDDRTVITPRVVGVYNNLGGGTETINGFISSILQRPKSLIVE